MKATCRFLLGALLLAGCGTVSQTPTTGPWGPLQVSQAGVDKALAAAGDNRKELQAALDSVGSERREAMEFLISQTAYRGFMENFGTMVPDAKTVTAKLLHANVEKAYEARETFPWARLLDEDTFRRFVLAYRMTTEKPVDWRSAFWDHPELRPLVDTYAANFKAATNDAQRSRVLRTLIHAINTGWVGKKVPYAPRGMPDHNPLEAIAAKTGRCTDETNTLIGILRTFGIAACGVRSVWWPDQGDNHTWTGVYDPAAREWLDVDSGQGGEAGDPAYFKRFIRDPNKRVGKIYWVVPGEENGAVRQALALKGDETYPPSVEKYLIHKPMVDRTDRYADAADLKRDGLPSDTLIWLAVRNGGAWKPIAGERSSPTGTVVFRKVGAGVQYRLMTWKGYEPAFLSELLTPNVDGTVATAPAPPQDELAMLTELVYAAFEAKKLPAAKKLLQRCDRLKPDDQDILYNLACSCSLLGEKDEAIDYLGKSIAAGWVRFPHIKEDTDLDNIRNEKRFIDLINASDESIVPPLPAVERPAERVELGYAIIVSRATRGDKDWSAVVDAFQKKYEAKVFAYDGTDPAAALQDLAGTWPRAVAFVARPAEATRRFVFRARQMMCALDEDPYEDAVWGIITGYDAGDCLRMAAAKPLVIRKAFGGVSDGWLPFFSEGKAFMEGEKKNVCLTKEPGKPVQQKDAPDDTTKDIVDALNSDQYQMTTTSGHATERTWKLGYGRENGAVCSKGGRLFGRDLVGKDHPITTSNPKIYYSPGNCLIGHISGPDCMALAWLHSGANQFFGHMYLQYPRGCVSWPLADYFLRLQGRFTYAESVYLSRANIVFRGLVNECCESTAFYGDPAWEARLSPEVPAPYEQLLEFKAEEGKVTARLAVTFNQDFDGPVAGAFLPKPICNQKVASVTAGAKATALDNAILLDCGPRKKGERIEAVVTAELMPLKKR